MRSAAVSVIRAMERAAIDSGIPEYTLMRRAGEGAARMLDELYPQVRRFVILCGGGNNGGDALVTADILASYGREVKIFSTKKLEDFTGCAAFAARDLADKSSFYFQRALSSADLLPGDMIIEGLLGIGFSGGNLRRETASFIQTANASGLPIAALDLPGGVEADSGIASPDGAIKAELTITFGAPKPGLFISDGALLRGKLRVIDIGLEDGSACADEIFTNIDAVKMLKTPPLDCHKNSRGRVAVFCGSSRFPGAAALAVSAAFHSGAGMVRALSAADLNGRIPNAAVFVKLDGTENDQPLIDEVFSQSDSVVAGCGWSSDAPVNRLRQLLDFGGKTVLDADGINLLCRNTALWRPRGDLIMTPHPGEAGRLADAFGIKADTDRRRFASELAVKIGCTLLLKGRDTVVAAPDGRTRIIAAGTPLLATAGSGDVLSGVIGALFADGRYSAFDAASLGAYIAGIAGEASSGIPTADEIAVTAGQVIRKLADNSIF